MKKVIRINEQQLRQIVKESINKKLNEAESYGWVVDSSEAKEAYAFFCDYMGKEAADAAIVETLGTEELSDALAFLFRMYEFREWYEHKKND